MNGARPRSRLDHESEQGMAERARWEIRVLGVDGKIAHALTIKLHGSNAYSIEGSINDEKLAHDILDNALDALRGYRGKPVATRGPLVVPGKDVTIGGVTCRQVTIETDVDDAALNVAVIQNAKSIITDMHARRKIVVTSENLSKIEI